MTKHNEMVVDTLSSGWNCYGQLIEKNKFASSLPRCTAKLRETLDTSKRDISKGLIGVLKFYGTSYNWFERMDGKVKYFYLEEIKQPIISNVVNGKLFDVRSFREVS